tara:strand:- start:1238 stop:2530 length:1293 start_codon:yes stop_codon:yes gene_type:complete
MTVIRPNSISGVTSITALQNSIEFYKSDGSLSGANIDGISINTAGIITANSFSGSTATFSDDVFINVRGKKFKTSDWSISNTTSGNALTISGGGSATEKIRINSSGFVGINETNPSTHLHVEQDNAHSSTYYLNSDAAILVQNKNSNASANTVIKLEGPTGGGACALVYGAGSTNMIFADRQNERMRISSNGAVSIANTRNYYGALNVEAGVISSGASGIDIKASGTNVQAISIGDHNTIGAQIRVTNGSKICFGTDTNHSLNFYTNGTSNERLRIDSGGRVTKPSQPMVGCRHFSQNGSTVYNDGNDIIALRFHNVDVNIGSHFNNTTGIFTCPVAGNYFISCQSNLRATSNSWSSVYIIYKPSGGSAQKLSDNWATSAINSTWSPISVSHLCNCNAGDEISMAYNAGYSAPSNSSTSGGVQMSIFLFG